MTTHLTRVDMRVLFSIKNIWNMKHSGANYLLEQVSNDRRGKGTINIQIT